MNILRGEDSLVRGKAGTGVPKVDRQAFNDIDRKGVHMI